MLLICYFRKGKIKVLFWKIKSSMKIKLKTTFQQLISKAQLEKCLNTKNEKRLAIVIIIGSKEDISKLCAKRFRFEGASKVVKKYWEAKTSLVFMICLGIGYN